MRGCNVGEERRCERAAHRLVAARDNVLMVSRRSLLLGSGAFAGLAAMGVGCASSPTQWDTLVGMAGYPWRIRLKETGPVQARRSFGESLDAAPKLLSCARDDKAEGRTSILSIKVPSWPAAAAGEYDVALTDMADRLDRLRHDAYVTVHHEPAGDGSAEAYARMQAHVLPLLRRRHVKVCVIVNGFWFSHQPERKPLDDSERAQWLPDHVLAACDVVAADCYQGGTPNNPGSEPNEQMIGLLEWSERVGHDKPLGVGEFSGHTASAITNVGRVLGDHPDRFAWACVYNSSRNNRPGVEWVLTDERLAAFKALVATNRT